MPPKDGDVDPVLLDPTRLSIVSLLSTVRWAEFGWVRDAAGLSDPALSKQITNLSGKGYLEVRKGHAGKRPRTWVNLSEYGYAALTRHIAGLQGIVDRAHQAAEERERPDAP